MAPPYNSYLPFSSRLLDHDPLTNRNSRNALGSNIDPYRRHWEDEEESSGSDNSQQDDMDSDNESMTSECNEDVEAGQICTNPGCREHGFGPFDDESETDGGASENPSSPAANPSPRARRGPADDDFLRQVDEALLVLQQKHGDDESRVDDQSPEGESPEEDDEDRDDDETNKYPVNTGDDAVVNQISPQPEIMDEMTRDGDEPNKSSDESSSDKSTDSDQDTADDNTNLDDGGDDWYDGDDESPKGRKRKRDNYDASPCAKKSKRSRVYFEEEEEDDDEEEHAEEEHDQEEDDYDDEEMEEDHDDDVQEGETEEGGMESDVCVYAEMGDDETVEGVVAEERQEQQLALRPRDATTNDSDGEEISEEE